MPVAEDLRRPERGLQRRLLWLSIALLAGPAVASSSGQAGSLAIKGPRPTFQVHVHVEDTGEETKVLSAHLRTALSSAAEAADVDLEVPHDPGEYHTNLGILKQIGWNPGGTPSGGRTTSQSLRTAIPDATQLRVRKYLIKVSFLTKTKDAEMRFSGLADLIPLDSAGGSSLLSEATRLNSTARASRRMLFATRLWTCYAGIVTSPNSNLTRYGYNASLSTSWVMRIWTRRIF